MYDVASACAYGKFDEFMRLCFFSSQSQLLLLFMSRLL